MTAKLIKSALKAKYYCPNAREYKYGLLDPDSLRFSYAPYYSIYAYVGAELLEPSSSIEVYLYY